MSLIPAWSPFFQSSVRMKGRALQLGEKIQTVPPVGDELAHAEVRDGNATQQVTLRAEGRHALAQCTCDQFGGGAFCPHIWGTILYLAQGQGTALVDLPTLSRLRLRPPKAQKRDGARRPARAAEPPWVGRLTLLRHSAIDRATAAPVLPVPRQVLYAVLPGLSQRHNGLVVDVRQRTAITSGWSKPKALRLSLETLNTLTDPADREIGALLLGAQWVSEHDIEAGFAATRSHGTFRVPGGAARPLLKQMIATGRCVLDLSDGQDHRTTPLTWNAPPPPPEVSPARPESFPAHQDVSSLQPEVLAAAGKNTEEMSARGRAEETSERAGETSGGGGETSGGGAWRLFLVGTRDAEDLRIDLELRRGHDRMPIHQPCLVLGGPDGLVIHQSKVAAFDDRDAFRWVSQFRDERYEDQPGAALHVAAADIPRFLDRLYLLPQLPELDLPDDLARAEQQVEPTPHLELFSPGSLAQRELAPSAAKGHVVARAWFDYHGTRISPAQPGRFVPLPPPPESPRQSPPEVSPPSSAASLARTTDPETDLSPQIDANAGGPAVAVADDPDPDDPQPRLLRRQRRTEQAAIAVLGSLGFRQTASDCGEALVLPTKQVPGAIAALLSRGWAIAADRQTVRSAGPPALTISSGIDWFELRGGVSFHRADGTTQEISLPEILRAARDGQTMIPLDDGTQGLLPHEWLTQHGLLTTLGELKDDHLRFATTQAAVLDAMLSERELVAVDDPFAEARDRLRRFNGIEALEPEADFQGALRPYQREGLGYLAFLRWFGAGGILADDMGLGKTVQVLAMIQSRRARTTDTPSPPSLIVVPRSLIFNWIDEAQKFTPELRVLAYTGTQRTEHQRSFGNYDLIVTSYGLLRRDITFLAEQAFDYVVLDEAQAIKNPGSQSAKAARLLQARHRLALTGTPIENHLGDLWSIFEFLNPGMLGTNTRFANLIRATPPPPESPPEVSPEAPPEAPPEVSPATAETPLGITPDTDAVSGDDPENSPSSLEQVARSLRPFILRRTKRQVLKDLPEKTEQTILCQMEPAQRKVYDDLRRYYRGTLLKQIDQTAGSPLGGGAFMVLEALLRLRQAACHPALITSGSAAGTVAENALAAATDTPSQDTTDPASAAPKNPSETQSDASPGAEKTSDRAGTASGGAGATSGGASGETSGGGEVPSAKLDALDEQLAEIIDEGSKALVFSQFTSMLALVRQRLDERGIRYVYLDGQTRNRKEVVEQFQTDPTISVFLISLKAGGTGLNLTAAEYVFILDPWWNPAVEAQAIDRTHRIGQTKPVFAYRLICEDTVEQRIIELQNKKRQLADAIVGGQQDLLRNLTRDDLEQLLS